jgi:outer membrane protein
MPGYAIVKNTLANMRSQYEAELKRVEQDFNLKYEEFLEGQRDFPETILRKRQTELKELLEHNVSFKAQGRQELAEAEAKAIAPLRERLEAALSKIGRERGYAFILNTDGDALPYVDSTQGEDVTEYVKREFSK